MINSIKQISKLLGPEKRKLPFLMFMIIFLSLLELLGIGLLVPYLNNIVYGNYGIAGLSLETYLQGDEQEKFIFLSILIVAAFLFKFFCSFFLSAGITYYAQLQRINLGQRLLESHLYADFITYLSRSDSDGIYEMQTATTHYFTAIQLILKFLSDVLILLVLGAFLFSINSLILIVTMGIITSVVGIYYMISKNHLIKFGKRVNLAESNVIKICQDAFTGFREIRFLNKASFFVGLLRAELLKVGRISIWLNLHAIAPRQLLELAIVFLFVVAAMVSRSLAIDNEQFTSIAMIYVVSIFRILPLITNMTAGLSRFRGLTDSIDRLHSTIDGLTIEIENIKENFNGSRKHTKKFTDIELKNVSYLYPESKNLALNNISMRINNSEIIGISGPSGIGKTTLINLLSGLLTPTSGQVLYNGLPISGLKLRDLSIAYIPQETVSINGSILRNIVLTDDISNEVSNRVMSLLEITNLSSVVKKMPNGLDTIIGQSGAKISSGQRQRIAIARALFFNKDLLILDEATNAVDIETESLIINNIRSQNKTISMLIISHRPSSLTHCDRIYRMDINGLNEVVDRTSFFDTLKDHIDKN
jgi:ATP-binding cassette, subfamily B, bacterial PglK